MRTVLAIALLAAAAPAAAAPRLVSATPAAGATVAAPATIELRTSETLAPKLSGATLVMTSMPGMADHADMKMPVAASIGKDGATIVLKPMKKLTSGSYRVAWHAAASNGDRADGTLDFSVK